MIKSMLFMFKKISTILLLLCMHNLDALDYGAQYVSQVLRVLKNDEIKQLVSALQKERQFVQITLTSLRLHAQEEFALDVLRCIAGSFFVMRDDLISYHVNFPITDASGIPLFVMIKKYQHSTCELSDEEEKLLYSLYGEGKIGSHYASLIQIFLQMKYHNKLNNVLTGYINQNEDIILNFSAFVLPYKIPSFLTMIRSKIQKMAKNNQWRYILADLKKLYGTYNSMYNSINLFLAHQNSLPSIPLLCEQDFDIPLVDIKKNPVRTSVVISPVISKDISEKLTTIFPWKKIDKRVSVWFEDVTGEKAFDFLNYAQLHPFVFQNSSQKQAALFAHTFSRNLDKIIVELTCAQWKEPFQIVGKNNKKEPFWLLSVPVFLEYKDGRNEQGYISYAISQKGILFHRGYAKTTCFDNETKDFLDAKLQDSYQNSIFDQSYNTRMDKVISSECTSSWSDSGVLQAEEQAIVIEDQRYQVKLIVPCMFTEDEVHATEFYKKYQNRCQRIRKKNT